MEFFSIVALCLFVSASILSSLFFLFTAVAIADAPDASPESAPTAPRTAGTVKIKPPFFASAAEMNRLFIFQHFTHLP